MFKNPVLKFADKYPLAVLIAVPIGIDYLFSRANSSGFGSIVWKEGAVEIQKTGKTGPTKYGTGKWDTVMPSPQGQDVRYDAEYHTQPWIDDPNFTPRERPVVQQSSVRHNYETMVFAGIPGINRL